MSVRLKLRLFERQLALRATSSSRIASSSRAASIKLPRPIQRSPTALLEALASTVGSDPTAPHYSMIDDPALTPTTRSLQRDCFMAKEMGRRAAVQLATEWPTLFMFDRDKPQLEAFRPKAVVDAEQADPTEENLLQLIGDREVQGAIQLFERIRAANGKISDTAKLSLFQLCAYYAESDPPLSECEKWAGLRHFGAVEQKFWRTGGTAELLFESLPRTADTYSTLIAGMCRHPAGDTSSRAWALFQEMHAAGHLPSAEACAGLVLRAENSTEALNRAKQLAKIVRPTAALFHALLYQIQVQTAKFDPAQRAKQVALVLGEMSALGLEPSLATFYYSLRSIAGPKVQRPSRNERGKAEQGRTEGSVQPPPPSSNTAISWLALQLAEIEGNPGKYIAVQPECATNAEFWTTAMEIAYDASNLEIARRLEKLYSGDTNAVRLPFFTGESEFYTTFLALAVEKEPDTTRLADDVYFRLVPRHTGLSIDLVIALAQRLIKSEGVPWRLTRRVVDDAICAGIVRSAAASQRCLLLLLATPFVDLTPVEREEMEVTSKRLVSALTDLAHHDRLRVQLFANQFLLAARLLARVGDEATAFRLIGTLTDPRYQAGGDLQEESPIRGVPTLRTDAELADLEELFGHALRAVNAEAAAHCIEIAATSGAPRSRVEDWVRRAMHACQLNQQQVTLLQTFARSTTRNDDGRGGGDARKQRTSFGTRPR